MNYSLFCDGFLGFGYRAAGPCQCPLNQLNLDKIVPNVRQSTLQAVIRGKIDLDSVIHSDGWRGYYGLVDVGYAKHFRVEHGRNEFANEKSLLMVSLNSAFGCNLW